MSLGVTRLKKTELVYRLELFWEGGWGVAWYSVCEAPLDDWANGGFVDVFLKYSEHGFSSMRT